MYKVFVGFLFLPLFSAAVPAQPPAGGQPDDSVLLDALQKTASEVKNSPTARTAAVDAMGMLTIKDQGLRTQRVQYLQKFLDDTTSSCLDKDDDKVVFLTHVVQVLGALGDDARRAAASIVRVCGHEEHLTQAATAAVAAILKPEGSPPHKPAVVAGLLADLGDAKDASKRLAAAKSLGELADPTVLAPLASAAAFDPDPNVKTAAAAAFAKVTAVLRLNRKTYVETLIAILDKKVDVVLRIVAAKRLGELGAEAVQAIEPLTAASKEDDLDLKTVATNALKRIQPK